MSKHRENYFVAASQRYLGEKENWRVANNKETELAAKAAVAGCATGPVAPHTPGTFCETVTSEGGEYEYYCTLADIYQRLGKICCFYIRGRKLRCICPLLGNGSLNKFPRRQILGTQLVAK
jgi:hypothetical protein